jgi:outer membrane protein TolC
VGGNALANRQSDQRPLRGSGQPDTYRSDQVNAAVGYELDLWGKARNELASRRDLAQAGDGDRRALELSLQAQLASSYFQLRGLDADIRLLDETCDAWQKSYDLTATLFRGKIAAQMDVSRARRSWRARVALADAAARRDLLVHAIAVLSGRNAVDFTLASGMLARTMPQIPTGIPAQVLQRRPDIASAERGMRQPMPRSGSIGRLSIPRSASMRAAGWKVRAPIPSGLAISSGRWAPVSACRSSMAVGARPPCDRLRRIFAKFPPAIAQRS